MHLYVYVCMLTLCMYTLNTYACIYFIHSGYFHSARDLGVILDQELSFTELTHSCFYQLRQLRVVSRSLSSSSTATLVHAFILNRLDYCSYLYLGLPFGLYRIKGQMCVREVVLMVVH